jgi:hypothetical protein
MSKVCEGGGEEMPSMLLMVTLYEPYIQWLLYIPHTTTYDILFCKVNNIVFAHLYLVLVWIVYGQKTVISFVTFCAGSMLMAAVECALYLALLKIDGGVTTKISHVEKILGVEKRLTPVGYISVG